MNPKPSDSVADDNEVEEVETITFDVKDHLNAAKTQLECNHKSSETGHGSIVTLYNSTANIN